MSAAALLGRLADLRVEVSLEGDRLRCRAPAGVLTDELRREIATSRDELIRALRESRAAAAGMLSAAQERLWLEHERAPCSAVYNIPLSVRLRGPLAVAALDQALGEVVDRHAVLRTAYVRGDDGVVRQRPLRAVSARTPLVDLSGLPASLAERTAQALAAAEARRPFDLARGSVFRTALIRRSPDEHRLLATRHHIASDGWSLGVLGGELAALTTACAEGRPSPLEPPPLTYADFAGAERAAGPDAHEGALAWWRERLDGAPARLAVLEAAAATVATEPAGRVSGELRAPVFDAVRQLARGARTTVFGVLLAAYAEVLGHAGGDDEIAVGVAVAGRGHTELEGLIGSFADVLPVRLAVRPHEPLGASADAAGAALADVLRHAAVPSQLIAEAVGAPGSLFEAAIVLQDARGTTLTPAAIEVDLDEPPALPPKYPLLLTASAEADGMRLMLEFDGRRLAPGVAGALLRRLEALLAEAGRGGAPRPVGEAGLELEPPAARAWHSPGVCLHELFERAARRAPDAVCVTQDGAAVTYVALDARTERLAAALAALGVGPETPVGVYGEPSAALVAGMLGVLKAGGAYVPLDPGDPPERLRRIAAEAGLRVVLVETRLRDRLGAVEGIALVPLDEPGGTAARRRPAVPPDAAAYVIHTSGSTGAPKGVVATHASAAALLAAADADVGAQPGDVWVLAHSFAFDFSVWELWGALTTGGRIVLPDRELRRSPAAMWELVRAQGVTILGQTPSAFGELADAAVASGADTPGALRAVVLGGERLEPAALTCWASAFGLSRPAILNMYGITETTVHATCHRVTRADVERRGRSPIGRPLAHIDAVATDPWAGVAPPGGRSELLLGGAGVARGYVGRPGQTAARFVPDPRAARPGARRYRSGDLVRRDGTGGLDYLGRADAQLDLRGHRIEPAEVEATLCEHRDVRAAAVALRTLASGRAGLVAYVVPATPDAPRAAGFDALRRHAAERLPAHMVPSRFVSLDRLPLTSTGKLDRAALPAAAPAAATAPSPPRTPTERALAELWAELTDGAAPLDMAAGFLEQGADSLLLARLHGRLPATVAADVPLRAVFEAPDPRALAALIDADPDGDLERLVEEVERMSDEEVLRLRG